LFFPVSAAGAGVGEIELAKAICARCAIRRRCLDFALDTRQPDGIWGGASEDERRVISARRRRLGAHVS
jgi:WhiB family redox-sensing transcriptional regulator